MKNKNLLLVLLAGIIYLLARYGGYNFAGPIAPPAVNNYAVQQAFAEKQDNRQIQGHGVVQKVLADDNSGTRHQRFILQVGPEQTVLVAHNIDISSRIIDLSHGDTVEFYGEYEWTDRGGVIHWTHHDPGARHINGWLRHNGRTYQ